MRTVVFATHNPGKLKELQAMMPEDIVLKSLDDIGCHDEIEETEDSFKGNALLKAQYVRDNYRLPCFADDSGLTVDALDGAPGVYTARYAGEHGNSDANMDKLLFELKDKESRSAQFVCVIALLDGDSPQFFEGICEGEILPARQGDGGFGYDPVFSPKGYSRSFAEMSLDEKAVISHRGKAVKQLIDFLRNS